MTFYHGTTYQLHIVLNKQPCIIVISVLKRKLHIVIQAAITPFLARIRMKQLHTFRQGSQIITGNLIITIVVYYGNGATTRALLD